MDWTRSLKTFGTFSAQDIEVMREALNIAFDAMDDGHHMEDKSVISNIVVSFYRRGLVDPVKLGTAAAELIRRGPECAEAEAVSW